MTKIPDDIKKLSFEKALEQLEEIVDNLESGNVDLEKSIEISSNNDIKRKATYFKNMGNLFSKMGDNDKALDFYKKNK